MSNALKAIVEKRDIFYNMPNLLYDSIMRHSSTPWRIVAGSLFSLRNAGTAEIKAGFVSGRVKNRKKHRTRLCIGHEHC
jgi:hypothetical protein